jgi:hypothetical protein
MLNTTSTNLLHNADSPAGDLAGIYTHMTSLSFLLELCTHGKRSHLAGDAGGYATQY